MTRYSFVAPRLYMVSSYLGNAIDVIAVYATSTALLRWGEGAALAAAIFLLDSVSRMCLPFVAAIVADKLPAGKSDYISGGLRFINFAMLVAAVAVIGGYTNWTGPYHILAFFALSRLASILDVYVRGSTQLYIDRYLGIPIRVSSSVNTLMMRGGVALYPILLVLLQPGVPWEAIFIPIALATLALYLYAPATGKLSSSDSAVLFPHDQKVGSGLLAFLRHNSSAVWYMWYGVLVNFAIGGVSYLLLVEATDTGGENLSALYLGLIVSQVALLAFPKFLPVSKVSLVLLTIVTGAGLIAGGILFQHVLIFGSTGVAYGLLIPVAAELTAQEYRAGTFRKYLASNQFASRAASAVSIALVAGLLAVGWPVGAVLVLCGALCASGSTILLCSRPRAPQEVRT